MFPSTVNVSNALVRAFPQIMSGSPELWRQDFLLGAVHSSEI